MTRCDLLVIGGGMAGLTAATKATRLGLETIVVEIADDVGGSARFAGYAWTAPSVEVMDRVNPNGDPELKHALVERFSQGIAWIRELGVDCFDPVPILGFGSGNQFDTNQYCDVSRRLIEESSGQVWLETTTEELLVEDGRVAGARVVRPDGTTEDVHARWTLIATGGFQGDPALLNEHVHPCAGEMQVRANPNSVGAGLRLATAVGASLSRDNAGFYGHLIPSQVSFADPADFVDLSLYYSEHALLFNLHNERFVDETVGDHLNTIALQEQPESRGLLIADDRVYQDWVLTSYVDGAVAVDKVRLAKRRNGRIGIATDLEEFDYLPEEWGYDGAEIRRQIEKFNAAAADQTPVSPARSLDFTPLDRGPWYVIECVPAITFPFTGIRIDTDARVLDHNDMPIPGLLCAGSDTGGLWDRAYAGGIASALVFGLAAATTAATDAGTH